LVPADDKGTETNSKKQGDDVDGESNSNDVRPTVRPNEAMAKCPLERKFFKILNAELRKSIHFFDKALQEFAIREDRVREGVMILRKTGYVMVSEKWSSSARSLYKLYKDLLLLETYSIMSFCAFSKILKKHDKCTGYDTRVKFVTNYVHTANFSNCKIVSDMIKRCERLYSEVAATLAAEGKGKLHEDERLFINMIQNLNKQVAVSAAEEGAPQSGSSQSESCENNEQSMRVAGPLTTTSKCSAKRSSPSLQPTEKEKSILESLLLTTNSTVKKIQLDDSQDSEETICKRQRVE